VKAKTCLQTNIAYDPRAALAVDAIIVHQHGADTARLTHSIGSWKQHGYTMGRMFFADSDGANQYWTGKWTARRTRRRSSATPRARFECAAASGRICSRPRLDPLPRGDGNQIDRCRRRRCPARRTACSRGYGYEEAFRAMWVERYGKPWQPESASAEARS